MRIAYACPSCQLPHTATVAEVQQLECGCGWSRPLPTEPAEHEHPTQCLVCGCRDLWRQKDFPQQVGIAMVALGAVLSTIAYANYMPLWSLGILLGFAAIDLILYVVMPDVLVCYRCSTRYRRFNPAGGTENFNLETAEKYRQEQQRVAKPS